MTEYIKREATLKLVEPDSRPMLALRIRNIPAEDVVEVIRCKDCKYGSPNMVYGCRINSFADDLNKRMYANDYCSLAVRREE